MHFNRHLGFLIIAALLLGCGAKEKKAPETAVPAPAVPSSQTKCQYLTELPKFSLEWTAFKFTNKTAVKGSFTTMQASGPEQADNLKALATGLSATIAGSTPDSKDPVRNGNVANSFFKKMASEGQLRAKIVELDGDDKQGKLQVEIEMNAKTVKVPFDYAIENELFVAKGQIDVMQFDLEAAFESLHKTCEVMHTGTDGVSKTWSDVQIQFSGPLRKQCS